MDADFIRIEPERNSFRFYRLAIWPDLFGRVSLIREWGRLGQPGTLRVDSYGSAEEARAALDRLARSKRRRGYRQAA
jgi:predicted DNA-binding WGR domain protein